MGMEAEPTTGIRTFRGGLSIVSRMTALSSGKEPRSGGTFTLNGTLNGAFNLTINSSGTVAFGAAVGGTTALTSVTTDAPGSTALNGGSVTTTGAQT